MKYTLAPQLDWIAKQYADICRSLYDLKQKNEELKNLKDNVERKIASFEKQLAESDLEGLFNEFEEFRRKP